MPERPASHDPGRPSGGSRARAGGSARPVGETPGAPAGTGGRGGTGGRAGGAPVPPRPSTRGAGRGPAAEGAGRGPAAAPAAPPPSFAPSAGGRRSPAAPGPRPVPPRAPAPPQRTAARPAGDVAPPAGPPRDARVAGARPAAARPAGSTTGAVPPSAGPPGEPGRPVLGTATGIPAGRPHRRRPSSLLAAALVLLLVWPLGLLVWANSRITHVEALSTAPDTPGITYLLAGSDSRGGEGGIAEDGTEGARTDTIMLLHDPPSGPPALLSLPRDTLVDIPGEGENKLNAAYSWGGAPLLVRTVEGLTGMHVDHYVEVGLGGVSQVVDALGGVELCLDPAVNQVTFPLRDPDSGLVWDAPGCRVVDGATSLAFARMRKSDGEGDIGRGKRQQQLIAALSSAAATPSLLVHPGRQVGLVSAGLGALQVSEGTGILDLARLGLAFRAASGPDGIRGTPPIADTDHRPGGIGSTVLLDPDATPGFFADIMAGDLPPGPVGGVPAP